MSFAHWVEHIPVFGRPLHIRQTNGTSCTGTSAVNVYSICRESAAGTCNPPDNAVTSAGDACVCRTLSAYSSKFMDCIEGPFATCLDPNDAVTLSRWSSSHCTSSVSSSLSSSRSISTTPSISRTSSSIITPTITPSSSRSTPPPPPPPSSTLQRVTSDPPSTFRPPPPPPPPPSSDEPTSTPVSSREEPTSTSRTTTRTTSSTETTESPSIIPSLSFVPIVTVLTTETIPAESTPWESTPGISPPVITSETLTTSTTHSPLPRWSGDGNLLQGYCATPTYTLLDGPTAFWLPVIGCVGYKTDCCPFDVPQTAAPIATDTQSVTALAQETGTSGENGKFPAALSPAQVTLDSCPDDYHAVGSGCCPSNYWPWTAELGGQTPCYSSIPTAMTPPPIPPTLIATDPAQKPTSAIVNVVYAMQYPVKPQKSTGLATNAKIGIGAGAGGAALVFGLLISLLIWKHRAHKRDKAALENLSTYGGHSNRLSTNQMSSRYSASNAGTSMVDGWVKTVPPPVGSPGRFHETGLEVGGPRTYAADWTPGQPTLPDVSLPPEMDAPPPAAQMRYSAGGAEYAPVAELGAQQQQGRRYSDGSSVTAVAAGHSPGNQSPLGRSELQGGEYFQRQELQGVPEGRAWSPSQQQQQQQQQQGQWGDGPFYEGGGQRG